MEDPEAAQNLQANLQTNFMMLLITFLYMRTYKAQGISTGIANVYHTINARPLPVYPNVTKGNTTVYDSFNVAPALSDPNSGTYYPLYLQILTVFLTSILVIMIEYIQLTFTDISHSYTGSNQDFVRQLSDKISSCLKYSELYVIDFLEYAICLGQKTFYRKVLFYCILFTSTVFGVLRKTPKIKILYIITVVLDVTVGIAVGIGHVAWIYFFPPIGILIATNAEQFMDEAAIWGREVIEMTKAMNPANGKLLVIYGSSLYCTKRTLLWSFADDRPVKTQWTYYGVLQVVGAAVIFLVIYVLTPRMERLEQLMH